MNKEHVISDELWDKAQASFSLNLNWIAYKTTSYFLDKRDMYFLKKRVKLLNFLKIISASMIATMLFMPGH